MLPKRYKYFLSTVFIVSSIFISGCVNSVFQRSSEEITYKVSSDLKSIEIRIPRNQSFSEEKIGKILSDYSDQCCLSRYFQNVEDDSLKMIYTGILRKVVNEQRIDRYSLGTISNTKTFTIITFVEDSVHLEMIADMIVNKYKNSEIESPVSVFSPGLSDNNEDINNLKLLLPCSGVSIPDWANLLPNAPRSYRSGTHRGIDFPSLYGAEVRSVANGVVIRADHGYQEITPDFRVSLLDKASEIKRTPSDIFNYILLGQSVFIDHGFNLIPGKRVISIYAHLSDINQDIQVGTDVVKGQQIGKTGNSGTKDGTLGKIDGAHLHFELIIQDESGERYLGKGLNYDELVPLLNNIFYE